MTIKALVNSTPGTRVSINSQDKSSIRSVNIRPETAANYLAGLRDVDIANVVNNQTIVYNASANEWFPANAFTFSSGALPHANPNYGDVWYYVAENRLLTWVTDGSSDFWYDSSTPVF